jgi:hypothetical protein
MIWIRVNVAVVASKQTPCDELRGEDGREQTLYSSLPATSCDPACK